MLNLKTQLGMGLMLLSLSLKAQNVISGRVTNHAGKPLAAATVTILSPRQTVTTNSDGYFSIANRPNGIQTLSARYVGYETYRKIINLNAADLTGLTILLREKNILDEVVVSGTMKEISKSESPVPVEVYSSKFFRANPAPTIFDALQNVNGVRPQLNCNVCNTGDIRINGLEGPYTMVLIDGMPIVSGLATVYGFSGIPQSLIERVEIVKGPASTLYGSEAVAGLINIITKSPSTAPLMAAESYVSSWGEVNTDLTTKLRIGPKVTSLLGINYFNYQQPKDKNHDKFTDVTLQHRISVFNKWNIKRRENRILSFAARYLYEDRWGGEMNWTKQARGGNDIYGESIYTNRWEAFGTYQLPFKERLMFQFSTNGHHQNSAYGATPFIADQFIAFGQLTWHKTAGKHELLSGLAYRYTHYDDNTPATVHADGLSTKPADSRLPGIFFQDVISINDNNQLLAGVRYDYNSVHGSIVSPRLNYKWNSANKNNVLRLSVGNGYRVANIFTEDHAALLGIRDVVFKDDLKPETSWNGNINFVKKMGIGTTLISVDASAFYTYFGNKIIADYDTHPNKIIFDNLKEYAVSKGASLNVDAAFRNGLKVMAGATVMDVFSKVSGEKIRQLFTERFSGTWSIGYTLRRAGISIDYTGNIYGPMRLPLLSETDPRKEYSPYWSIQNVQLTKRIGDNFELYGGIKNLLNWTPNKRNPFIIARANDPFDKHVQFDPNGNAMVTPDNPYGLTFDPSYVYASNQGIRGFLGLRYTLK